MSKSFLLVLSCIVAGFFSWNASADSEHTHRSVSKVWTFSDSNDGSPIPEEDRVKIEDAKSKIVRTDDSVCITTKTRDLPPGAYTNWWVMFNDPANCVNGTGFGKSRCGSGDPAAVMWATGGIVGPDGVGYFNACINEGEVPGQLLRPPGLTNANAEIHVIIKWHGDSAFGDAQRLGEQLTSVSGACDQFAATNYLGMANCPDPQIVIHRGK